MNDKQQAIAQKLNTEVSAVIGETKFMGFEKAYLVAEAVGKLKTLLTAEYMKPIMELQGNRLGFKTDKDGNGGYPETTVKNCLIEAVLTGVQPFENQFNIIAGNMYITKEGFGFLLKNIAGLSYDIVFELPRIGGQNPQSAAVVAKVSWTMSGNKFSKEMDIPVKLNAFMGTDAVIGKATRKARAWLYNTITGSEVSDGDAVDNDALKTIPIKEASVDKEAERLTKLIEDSTSLEELMQHEKAIGVDQQDLFEFKKQQLSK